MNRRGKHAVAGETPAPVRTQGKREVQALQGLWNTAMSERRTSGRFPIEREVRYKVISRRGQEAGTGKTVNISSSGILFSTEQPLETGKQVEISVAWPAQLNNQTPLKLVARGRLVRVEDHRAALEIQHYEFRTQAMRAS
jgi:hypothetical protein